MVAKLVLQTERLVSSSGYVGFTLQFAPTIIIPKPDCRPYWQSRVGCRFGRSGSSGFVGGFRLLRLSSCVPAPKVRNCRDRCRNRYTCRPKQIWFLLRGRLKLLRFSDGLCLSFCPRHCSCTPKFLSYHLFLRIPL